MGYKKTISVHVLTLGVVSLLMAGSLVIYQIYSAFSKSQISDEQTISIKPLDGDIKKDVIENLKSRRWFSRVELEKKIIQIEPETVESTKSAETRTNI